MIPLNDETKHILDWTSVGAAVGTLLKLLPDVASILTVVWLALRIWESETVKEWRGKKDGDVG
jgi:hypothetical protein